MSQAIIAVVGVPHAHIEEVDELIGAVASVTKTCPDNTRWMLISANSERDVNATVKWEIFNAADHLLVNLGDAAAGVSTVDLFGIGDNKGTYGWMLQGFLQGGDYIKITYGVAQTNPRITMRFLEVAE